MKSVESDGHSDISNKFTLSRLTIFQVIQIYLQWDTPGLPAPKLQLVGFKRIHLPAGERDTVYFIIKGQQMELWFEDINDFNVVPGELNSC